MVLSLTQAVAAESDGVDDDGMAALGTAIAIPIANSLIDSYLTSNVIAGLIDSNDGSDVIAKKSQSNPILFPDIQGEIVKSKLEFEKKMNQIADVEMRYTDMNNFLVSGRFELQSRSALKCPGMVLASGNCRFDSPLSAVAGFGSQETHLLFSSAILLQRSVWIPLL